MRCLQLKAQADITSEMCGGPVVEENGLVIGVVRGGQKQALEMCIASPSEQVRNLCRQAAVRFDERTPETIVASPVVAGEAKPKINWPLWDGKETVAVYAKRACLEPTQTLDLGGGVKLEFVLVPPGQFMMGSGDAGAQLCEKPVHKVTISQPYYLGKFEITQEQYQQVMGTNPSHFKERDLPVEWVSWNDAQVFCKKASEKTGQAVRLPTEAEGEHACRSGTRTTYCTGDAEADLDPAAWYDKNSLNTTHPVGLKAANAWGLYDMHGNVWEWCEDFYGPYKAQAAVDPQGPDEGAERVLRGGSWNSNPGSCRSASRLGRIPDCRADLIGFRVAFTAAGKP